ncbi:hypothetical protein ACI2KR_08680 [Pseudomonas luteola]
MRYVPRDLDAARQWCEVCAESMGISIEEAYAIYAHLCGFQSWRELEWVAGNMGASNYDENVPPRLLMKRYSFYEKVLKNKFGFRGEIARYIAHRFSPSSKLVPEIVSIDISRLKDKVIDNAENLSDTTVQKCPKDTKPHKIEPVYVFNSDRNGLPVEKLNREIQLKITVSPVYWFNLLGSLGWNVLRDSFNNNSPYEPSFIVAGKNTKEFVPVYNANLTRYPYDTKDSLCNELIQDVENDLKTRGYKRAILFWFNLSTKKINGLDYTHPGLVYVNGQWKETLINTSMNDVEELFLCAELTKNINSPHPDYADKNKALLLGFKVMFTGVKSIKELKLIGVTSPSGWMTFASFTKET